MNGSSELEEGYVDGDMYPVDGPLQSGMHSLRRVKSTTAPVSVYVCVCVCVCVRVCMCMMVY